MEEYNIQKEIADRYSLRGRVYNTIRDKILSGDYRESEELRENTIATELGVSRTPVREALRQLELEGLVSIIPNKGAFVTGITKKDIHDIYTIRSYLEGLCAKWACDNITNAQIEALEEILYLSDFHARRSHFEQMVELDNKFHDLIYKASGSKILNHVLSDFHQYVERVRKITLSRPYRAEQSRKEHAAIVEALKNRDGDQAEALAHEHMKNTIQNLTEQGL
ncbi:MAG: GntR family transcriptional regulator [Clostridiales bacterium]|nr:GntR family transcriptional regulator [Clostridiales bacterium]